MDTKQAVDDYAVKSQQLAELKREVDALDARLNAVSKVGDELQGHKYRIRRVDRAVLDPTLLEQAIPATLWRRITKRVPVADLYKAEIVRGKLTNDTMQACQGRSKSWFKIVR
jgi:hypothetical protein